MAAPEQEDAIDLQDLQAQIDLSMSFAQNLVTSWVQPTQFSKSARQRDLESEIKEYMRRPARLGVGAPIPETQSLAREAARLKTKLGGKKRPREEKNAESAPLPSDDEESRAGAIKKKARKDPFDLRPKKGNNEKPKGAPTTQIKSAATDPVLQSHPTTVAGKALYDAPSQTSTNSSPATDDQIPSPASKVCGALLKSPTSTPAMIPVGVSRTAAPLLSPAHHVQLFKQPLLNLGGSPNEDETEVEKANSSPKRKRKRRKKKKSSQDVKIPLGDRR